MQPSEILAPFLFSLVRTTPRPSPKRKRRGVYSKGEVNRLVDSLLHPLFDLNPAFSIADAMLHGFVEQNPPETALKFLRYNLPRIIVELTKAIAVS